MRREVIRLGTINCDLLAASALADQRITDMSAEATVLREQVAESSKTGAEKDRVMKDLKDQLVGLGAENRRLTDEGDEQAQELTTLTAELKAVVSLTETSQSSLVSYVAGRNRH